MAIINLTPHTINVRSEDGTEIAIPPSGQVARVSTTREQVGEVLLDGKTFPSFRTVFGTVEGLPAPTGVDTFIVSTLVAQVGGVGRFDVLSPDTGPSAIRENGQVVAVRGFQSFA